MEARFDSLWTNCESVPRPAACKCGEAFVCLLSYLDAGDCGVES